MHFVAFDPPPPLFSRNFHSQRMRCTSMETSSCGSNRSDSPLLCFILSAAVQRGRSAGKRAVFLELLVFPSINLEGRTISFPGKEIKNMFLGIVSLLFIIGTSSNEKIWNKKSTNFGSTLHPGCHCGKWVCLGTGIPRWPKNVVNLVFFLASWRGSKPQI